MDFGRFIIADFRRGSELFINPVSLCMQPDQHLCVWFLRAKVPRQGFVVREMVEFWWVDVSMVWIDETLPCSAYRNFACQSVSNRCVYEETGKGYNVGYCRAPGLILLQTCSSSWMVIWWFVVGEQLPCYVYGYEECQKHNSSCYLTSNSGYYSCNDVYWSSASSPSPSSTSPNSTSPSSTSPSSSSAQPCSSIYQKSDCNMASECKWSPQQNYCYNCSTYNCLLPCFMSLCQW